MTIKWQPGSTAPKDGTHFYAWLYEDGIRKMRWSTAAEWAAKDGGDVEDYIDAFVEVADEEEVWAPRWWIPLNDLPEPPAS